MNLPTPYEVLQDPAASQWLKDSLRRALQRDPVDAANDTAWLADYMRARCESILRASERVAATIAVAVLVASQFPADVYTAGQTSAPVCIEYCGARS